MFPQPCKPNVLLKVYLDKCHVCEILGISQPSVVTSWIVFLMDDVMKLSSAFCQNGSAVRYCRQ